MAIAGPLILDPDNTGGRKLIMNKSRFSIKSIAACGVSVAIATLLSYVKIIDFPFGGSATAASMLFVVLPGFFYGPAVGIIAATSYGLLQFVLDPYFLFPAQFITDYILAFGSLGLSGLMYKKKNGLLKGYLLGVTGRFIFTTLSGFIFFAEYAWDGWNPILYSMVYNGAYIFSEAALTVILISIPAVRKAILHIKSSGT